MDHQICTGVLGNPAFKLGGKLILILGKGVWCLVVNCVGSLGLQWKPGGAAKSFKAASFHGEEKLSENSETECSWEKSRTEGCAWCCWWKKRGRKVTPRSPDHPSGAVSEVWFHLWTYWKGSSRKQNLGSQSLFLFFWHQRAQISLHFWYRSGESLALDTRRKAFGKYLPDLVSMGECMSTVQTSRDKSKNPNHFMTCS